MTCFCAECDIKLNSVNQFFWGTRWNLKYHQKEWLNNRTVGVAVVILGFTEVRHIPLISLRRAAHLVESVITCCGFGGRHCVFCHLYWSAGQVCPWLYWSHTGCGESGCCIETVHWWSWWSDAQCWTTWHWRFDFYLLTYPPSILTAILRARCPIWAAGL